MLFFLYPSFHKQYRTLIPSLHPSISSPPQKSQLPSFHPVLHLSSHFPQSNSFFPSFTFTALCASHIQRPNSSLLLTRGAFPFSRIHAWKSPAQCQHGYSVANVRMKVAVSDCSCGEGATGYEAVMECRRSQEERPRAVMSGGQSARGTGAEEDDFVVLVSAKREETSVQVRQLGELVRKLRRREGGGMRDVRFSVWAEDDAFGELGEGLGVGGLRFRRLGCSGRHGESERVWCVRTWAWAKTLTWLLAGEVGAEKYTGWSEADGGLVTRCRDGARGREGVADWMAATSAARW